MSETTPVSAGGHDAVLKEVKDFLEARFLPEGETGIEATTPLLEWGILTSISTTELIAFIQDRYGLFVPPEMIVGSNFKNLEKITELVLSLENDPLARA
ncbi:acyl carrier protein [Streptomyces sedi]|uniref:Acyl carrier protein n=1 Tax=Streptomyces sedi TaxID=555059 RepID=A0A5C4V3T4_9ACTN|nr:acyl carrier protein [Streptomyces sedi]TNM30584.1 acyl carrier protein [Streptomyces sedi]